jgi:hypothetical protein
MRCQSRALPPPNWPPPTNARRFHYLPQKVPIANRVRVIPRKLPPPTATFASRRSKCWPRRRISRAPTAPPRTASPICTLCPTTRSSRWTRWRRMTRIFASWTIDAHWAHCLGTNFDGTGTEKGSRETDAHFTQLICHRYTVHTNID